jgi:hypothetical protein
MIKRLANGIIYLATGYAAGIFGGAIGVMLDVKFIGTSRSFNPNPQTTNIIATVCFLIMLIGSAFHPLGRFRWLCLISIVSIRFSAMLTVLSFGACCFVGTLVGRPPILSVWVIFGFWVATLYVSTKLNAKWNAFEREAGQEANAIDAMHDVEEWHQASVPPKHDDNGKS